MHPTLSGYYLSTGIKTQMADDVLMEIPLKYVEDKM